VLQNKLSFGKKLEKNWKKIRRCKINKALQNKLSVAKYTKRCKINMKKN
jgi:hypothetical protein